MSTERPIGRINCLKMVRGMGQGRVTMRDIGGVAGVSYATVSYVLSGKGDANSIPLATQERVREAAQQLGWRRNHLLSVFLTGKTRMIGLWQLGLGQPYHASVMQEMEGLLFKDGYAMLTSPARVKDKEGLGFDLGVFSEWSVDGLVALDGAHHIRRFFATHPKWSLPMVNMGWLPVTDYPGLNSVYVDVLTPIRTGLERWIKEGRQRIAMLTGRYPWDTHLDQRESLYRDVARDHGFEPEIVAFSAEGDQRHAAGAALAAHVAAHGYPDAVFCRKDEILLGAYRTLRHRGCAIPKDVALLGVDGIRDLEFLDHPVSTVKQPVEKMCQTAWLLLKEQLENSERPARHVEIESRLVWLENGEGAT